MLETPLITLIWSVSRAAVGSSLPTFPRIEHTRLHGAGNFDQISGVKHHRPTWHNSTMPPLPSLHSDAYPSSPSLRLGCVGVEYRGPTISVLFALVFPFLCRGLEGTHKSIVAMLLNIILHIRSTLGRGSTYHSIGYQFWALLPSMRSPGRHSDI
ncbi:hypothetical protein B0H63DRAFT_473091 [Podospora didyma]|uniref:Uncharacterized protein n=1 Tax=Podospora didyma TaxID=330526 RepID=A0AAE0NPZ5_9PEZI|nr:hypothetical protein B0H63DRAFT_473091 [Podospora didyma]